MKNATNLTQEELEFQAAAYRYLRDTNGSRSPGDDSFAKVDSIFFSDEGDSATTYDGEEFDRRVKEAMESYEAEQFKEAGGMTVKGEGEEDVIAKWNRRPQSVADKLREKGMKPPPNPEDILSSGTIYLNAPFPGQEVPWTQQKKDELKSVLARIFKGSKTSKTK